MNDVKIYRCKHCGNIITKIYDSSVKVVCCGEEMEELIPNTTDASFEKHVPVVENAGHMLDIKIGETPHPMEEEHYIMWVMLVTESGTQLKYLHPTELPEASFTLIDDKPLSVFSYCNIHGLWKKDIK